MKCMQGLQPILFEECYVKSMERIKSMSSEHKSMMEYKGVHLFVMVHGFQGNSCDMRLLIYVRDGHAIDVSPFLIREYNKITFKVYHNILQSIQL